MKPRENFIYYVLGMVNFKIMTANDFKSTPTKLHIRRLIGTTNAFLATCNEPPLMPFEIRYIEKIRQYDIKLNAGMDTADKLWNE